MLSDRLRAEPYLFNTYIYLLAAIAGTSSASADAVYEFIEKAPSEHVSWPIMVNALNEAERLLQSEGAQRGLLDPDLTGFIAILTLLANIIRRSTACPTIRSSLQANTIEVCLKLLHQPLHVALKARLCQVLAAIAARGVLRRAYSQAARVRPHPQHRPCHRRHCFCHARRGCVCHWQCYQS